jgi:hypothetical protein
MLLFFRSVVFLPFKCIQEGRARENRFYKLITQIKTCKVRDNEMKRHAHKSEIVSVKA